MRVLLAIALACAASLSFACESGTIEDPVGPRAISASANWPVPAGCFSTQVAVDIDDEPAGADADDNGNGWVCRVIDSDPVAYEDDHVDCPSGTDPVFHEEGHPDDENGNGFVCEGGDIVVDDTTDTSGEVPGPIGGDGDCPAGYALVEYDVSLGIFDPADEDEDGKICVDENGMAVDDGPFDAPLLVLTPGKVNGHGVYDAGDPSSTLSFSFHARSDGASARGNFEFHDRDSGARYHGDVTCLEIDGITAMLEGVVTNAKHAASPVGTVVTWIAVDNGEGKNAPADEVSEPEIGDLAGDPCGPAPTGSPVVISGGNVQVK